MIKKVKLRGDYITLTQLLKEEGIVASGGQVKFYLKASPVQLNGQPEQRRGKKLHDGDQVVLTSGESFQIVKA